MEHLKVTALHYKLRGVCQSCIVEASDGFLYVLKTARAASPNLLFNEAFGSNLLRHFGLPVADWQPVSLDNDFIEANPEMWFISARNNSRRPAAGLHFGSRLVSSKRATGAYQIIPSSWASKVRNRPHFLGALAIDIWSNHCDRRQAIYTPCGEGLKATFIDNGHMFGGLAGKEVSPPRCCMAHDLNIYTGLESGRGLRRWYQRIMNTEIRDLMQLTENVPTEWYTPQQLDRALETLHTRRKKLGSLFREAGVVLGQLQSWSSKEFVNSLVPHIQEGVASRSLSAAP